MPTYNIVHTYVIRAGLPVPISVDSGFTSYNFIVLQLYSTVKYQYSNHSNLQQSLADVSLMSDGKLNFIERS